MPTLGIAASCHAARKARPPQAERPNKIITLQKFTYKNARTNYRP
jgi:hypothetical protein